MAENIKLPSKIVTDASVILALLLPDESIKPSVTRILEQYAQGKVSFSSTHLLDFEVLNGIRSAILSKRIGPKIGQKLANAFLQLKISRKKIDFRKTFRNALQFSLPVYDAGYLTLAKEARLPLITADRKLKRKIPPKFTNIIAL